MGELNVIPGKLEVMNGATGSDDVVQEWFDKDGNVVGQLLANKTLKIKYIDVIAGETRLYIDNDIYLRSGEKINFNVGGSTNEALSIKATDNVGGTITSGRYTKFYNWGTLYAEFGGLVRTDTAMYGNYIRNLATESVSAKGLNGSLGNDLNMAGGSVIGTTGHVTNQGGATYIRGGKSTNTGTGIGGSVGGILYLDGGIAESNADIEEHGNIAIASLRGFVGVGTSTPSEKLDITETTKTQGRRIDLKTKTSDYTVTKSDHKILLIASSNTILIELLDINADNHGQEYIFKAKDVSNLIKIIAFTDTLINVDGIVDEGSNVFRYVSSSGSYSGVNTGDYIKVTNSTDVNNDGTFEVIATDSDTYVEITNINGVAETSDSKVQLTGYDYAMTILDEVITLNCDNDNNTYEEF